MKPKTRVPYQYSKLSPKTKRKHVRNFCRYFDGKWYLYTVEPDGFEVWESIAATPLTDEIAVLDLIHAGLSPGEAIVALADLKRNPEPAEPEIGLN